MTTPNGIFINSTLWKDNITGATPPATWQAVTADDRFWWYGNLTTGAGFANTLIYIGDMAQIVSETVELDWQITIAETGNTGGYAVVYRFDPLGLFTAVNIGHTVASGAVTVAIPSTATYFEWGLKLNDGGQMYGGQVAIGGAELCTDSSEFNCACDTVSPYDTLANVRTRMLIRLGYPNQVANPPPGMASLIDEFLRGAQREIYRQVQRAARRTERFYRWTMVPGLRYYGLQSNDDCCDFKLDPEKVTWVGFEDLNKAWYRLDDGIPPEYYTRANINFGWPTRFEIRSCIEIFPAPQAAYTLWVKGDFGLSPLAADTDRFTIDDEAVFLLALGNAKGHYGQKDAQLVLTQAGNYMKGVVAGAHGTKRFVPRSETENPLTPPKFLPLGSSQA